MTEFPTILANGITDLDMGGCGVDTIAANRFLDWLAKSSNSTLSKIYLDSNSLTNIPTQIALMTKLAFIDMSFNQITTIQSGDLSFTAPVTNLYLRANSINSVEFGAFQGIPNDKRCKYSN